MKGPPHSLLLVDDNPHNLVALGALLEPYGYRLVRAVDGLTALASFERDSPDIVLCDLMMPGMDGIEVMRRIRCHPDRGHTPVVLLTAYGEREHRLRALEAGADEFLDKPLDTPILLARIATLLRLKRSRDDLVARHVALQRLQREQRETMECLATDVGASIAGLQKSVDWLGEYADAGPGATQQAVSAMRAGLLQLTSTVHDLSWISWLDSSVFPVQRATIRLDDLVGEVAEQFAQRAAERNVQLSSGRRVSIAVAGDERLLRRVIENLLDNALRHTQSGGNVLIEARADENPEVYVCNDGSSIPHGQRQRIFEKFVRADAEPAAAGHPGLGLYFCRRALEEQGAGIEVVDEPGWPTAFVIRFRSPADPADSG